MRDLIELQRNFQAYLLYQAKAIKPAVISTDHVPAETRLEIYRHAYYGRLIEALSHDYPILYQSMDAEEFHCLCELFIQAFPSKYRSIRWFGNELAKWMRETKPYDDKPWLSDLAEFEWLLTEAFDAKDCAVMTVESMANIPFDHWPTLRFKLHPSIRQINLVWNTVSLWTSMKEKDEYLPPEKQAVETTWLIWRNKREVQFSALTMEERYILNAMASGHDFSEICEGLCEWQEDENIAAFTAQLLKKFITDGLILEIAKEM